MQEVYEFLKNCGTYYLATVEGDQPRVRPFGTDDNTEVLYFKDATAAFCSFTDEPKIIKF